MRAGRRIEARVRRYQPLDGFSTNDVRIENLVDIFRGDVSIPNRLRINNDIRAVLALVEASGLIGADLSLQAAPRDSCLEKLVQFSAAIGVAASAWMSGLA